MSIEASVPVPSPPITAAAPQPITAAAPTLSSHHAFSSPYFLSSSSRNQRPRQILVIGYVLQKVASSSAERSSARLAVQQSSSLSEAPVSSPPGPSAPASSPSIVGIPVGSSSGLAPPSAAFMAAASWVAISCQEVMAGKGGMSRAWCSRNSQN